MNQLFARFTLFSSWGFWRRFLTSLVTPHILPRFSSAKVSLFLDEEWAYLLSWQADRAMYVSVEVAGKQLGWFPYGGYLKLQFNQEGPVPVVLKARSLFQTQSTRFLILVSSEQPDDIHLEVVLLTSESLPKKALAPKLHELVALASIDTPSLVSPYATNIQPNIPVLLEERPMFAHVGFSHRMEEFTLRSMDVPLFSIKSPSMEIDLHLQPNSYV
jgi:hypothetical protein